MVFPMAFIRMAELRDAAAIAHVHVQSWLTTYKGIVPQEYLASLNEAERTSSWEDWLARDIIVAVAEVDGEIVGFAGGGPIREPLEPYDAELYTLYLLENEQGRGLGKSLLCVVAQALLAAGYESMLVWVLKQNPAVGFYQKAGGQHLRDKQIEIGGVSLCEAALGWPDLKVLSRLTADQS
jgi:GNAT superfamily N-acetyltransferase